ncbi:MAG TPA: Spy/CpxP family protein refolding chaperone, partial [Tenuifilaceae bacterium]|nr:Spy/CpxP family protein refolding chaperone [Tenuifilaceae bacterium]
FDMKTKIFKTAILSVAIGTMALTMGHDAFAQRGMGMGMGTGRPMQRMNNQNERPYMGQFIPNLSEEQQAKMDELRTKHLKEVTPLRNELNEKRARLQTLESAEKIDINAINKTIDEIAQLRANIMKKGAAHRAEVSSILTDDQRAVFNSRRGGRMGKRGMGNRGRMGNCPYMQ